MLITPCSCRFSFSSVCFTSHHHPPNVQQEWEFSGGPPCGGQTGAPSSCLHFLLLTSASDVCLQSRSSKKQKMFNWSTSTSKQYLSKYTLHSIIAVHLESPNVDPLCNALNHPHDISFPLMLKWEREREREGENHLLLSQLLNYV